MTRFNFMDTPIKDLKVVERKLIEDSRGYFSRFFCKNEFNQVGLKNNITQINHSYSKYRGTVRGMHFQLPPHAESKFVSCIHGSIFDIAVDLRKNSPTFLNWYGEVLSEANHRSLFIPEGFAHGFQALTDDCELLYLVSANYEPTAEKAINAMDPLISINWPLHITEMSEKDRDYPMVSPYFKGIEMDKEYQEIEYL